MFKQRDSDLARASKRIDVRLERLQNAAQLAILGNLEKLDIMHGELATTQRQETAGRYA